MHSVGDFARGCRVDGRAVYEEAFGGCDCGWGREGREGWVEDVVEDVFDVGGLGKGCYDYFLGSLSAGWLKRGANGGFDRRYE